MPVILGSRRRVIAAFLFAPVASVLAFLACIAITHAWEGVAPSALLAELETPLMLTVIFGLPSAYLAELGVGLPLFLYWQRQGKLRPAAILGAATVIGALAMPLAGLRYWGGPFSWWPVGIGAILGFAAGLAFAAIAFRRARSRPAI